MQISGIQESKIICVEDELETPVSPINCRLSDRPEVKVQTCNDHPCPPRWNVTEFGPCDLSCGCGKQVRNVSCIQEVRHGSKNILTVDESFCPQPPPVKEQLCNMIDCPAKWTASDWSKVKLSVKVKLSFYHP